MTYFDACEACGQTEFLVLGGLCYECQHDAERAANGGRALERVSTMRPDDDRIMVRLAGRERQEVRPDG